MMDVFIWLQIHNREVNKMCDFFYFKGNVYSKGAIIQLKPEYKENFGFHSSLVFQQYDQQHDIYYFESMYDWSKIYKIEAKQLSTFVKDITPACRDIKGSSSKVKEDYIEGIVSAWIWYIVIMLFALFLKEPGTVIFTWISASFIFFRWRHIKLHGG